MLKSLQEHKESSVAVNPEEDLAPEHETSNAGETMPRRSRAWWKLMIGFWIIGLLNNIVYVVMNAGAKSIAAGGVGMVYVANVAPSFAVKLLLPYVHESLPYSTRVAMVALLNVLCLMLVGLTSTLTLQLLGVCFGAMASSLGEASFLAYGSRFSQSRDAITAWSSGTGMAGIAGYAWVLMWTEGAGLDFSTTSLTGLVLPTFWVMTFHMLLPKPDRDLRQTDCVEEDGGVPSVECKDSEHPDGAVEAFSSTREKFVFIATKLWPYMVPLFLVYWAEYAMQAGAWAAIGMPMYSTAARAHFYSYSNWLYQVGVFVSRSSGSLFTVSQMWLWLMPIMQVALLGFFVLDGLYSFWLSWGLLLPAFVTGLLGGAVYCHGFNNINRDIEPRRRETALAAASVADTFGIFLADVTGIFLQGCMYAANDLVDCTGDTCSAPTFTCGHTFNTTFNPAYL